MLEIEDEDGIPPSPFCPLLEQARTDEAPLVSLQTGRKLGGEKLMLQGFEDRVVGISGDQAYFLSLDCEVSFGYRLEEKKIWFTNR